MGNGETPCRYCEVREVGCHSTCESYLEWKYQLDQTNAEIRKRKHYDDEIYAYGRERHEQRRRAHGQRHR